jgi:hypothetical protein
MRFDQRTIKAKHLLHYRTVSGKMTIDSLQRRVCKCSENPLRKRASSLAAILAGRLRPELAALQIDWAAGAMAVADDRQMSCGVEPDRQ